MKLPVHLERRLPFGLVLAAMLAGAGALPVAANALPQGVVKDVAQDIDVTSFSSRAQGVDSLAAPPEEGSLQWSAPGAAGFAESRGASEIYAASAGRVPGQTVGSESFSTFVRERHGGNGGGWGDHGEFDDNHGGRCDDNCVIPSAVPEPSRTGLLTAGAVAVFIFIRRRRGGAGVLVSR